MPINVLELGLYARKCALNCQKTDFNWLLRVPPASAGIDPGVIGGVFGSIGSAMGARVYSTALSAASFEAAMYAGVSLVVGANAHSIIDGV